MASENELIILTASIINSSAEQSSGRKVMTTNTLALLQEGSTLGSSEPARGLDRGPAPGPPKHPRQQQYGTGRDPLLLWAA